MAHSITDAEGKLHKISGNFNPSYDVSQLVAEKTVTSNTQTFTIDKLDIIRDGGVYDVVIVGNASTSVNMQISVSGQTYPSGTGFFLSAGQLTANNNYSYMWAGYWDNNACFCNMTVTCINGLVGIFSTTIAGNVITYSKGTCGTSNITSITLNTGTSSVNILAGTTVKIYKRMANATVSKTNGVKFERLWVNPDPNASFSTQTVNLKSADWDYLIITSQNSDTHARTTSVIFSRSSPSSVGATLNYLSSSSSYGPINYVRHCNIINWNGNPTTSYAQVYFENCYEGYSSAEVMDNRSCVPNEIIGIKVV